MQPFCIQITVFAQVIRRYRYTIDVNELIIEKTHQWDICLQNQTLKYTCNQLFYGGPYIIFREFEKYSALCCETFPYTQEQEIRIICAIFY